MLLSLVYFYLQIFFVGFAIPLLLVFRRYPIARKIFVKIFLNNIFCLDLYKVVLLLRYTFDFVVSSFLPFCVLLVWNFDFLLDYEPTPQFKTIGECMQNSIGFCFIHWYTSANLLAFFANTPTWRTYKR